MVIFDSRIKFLPVSSVKPIPALRLIGEGSFAVIAVLRVHDIFSVGRKKYDSFCEELNPLVPIDNLGKFCWSFL